MENKPNLVVTLLLCFMFCIPTFTNAQIYISGKIIDKESGEPVEFATVYINGTTLGTITNTKGYFHLDKIKPPCTLVISHVSYETFTTELKQQDYPELGFVLIPKEISLREVDIQDKNLRIENLKSFENEFLGKDVWGKYATIENEDVLRFRKVYREDTIPLPNKTLPAYMKKSKLALRWSEDSTKVFYPTLDTLEVIASEPIEINLELLGYKIYVDLVKYVQIHNAILRGRVNASLGYYRFVEVLAESKSDFRRIQKNRQKAYYNSSQHFLRSLIDSTLSENAYEVYEKTFDDSLRKNKYTYVSLDSFMIRESDCVKIVNANKKIFLITYRSDYRNRPISQDKKKYGELFNSNLYFLSDTCTLRYTGTTVEDNVLFVGEISKKQVGAMLPEDYRP